MTPIKRSLLSAGIISSLTLSGCGGSSSPGDSRLSSSDDTRDQTEQETFCTSDDTVFAVTEFFPENDATGVSVNSSVRITFNANVNPDTVSGNALLLVDGVNAIALGDTTVSGKSVVLTPLDPLSANTGYTIQVLTGISADCSDSTLKSLAEADSATFMTGDGDTSGEDTSGPTVISTNPESGDTLVFPDSRIYVEFDKPVNPATVTDTSFSVRRLVSDDDATETVAGVVNPVGNAIEFTPDASLDSLAYYEVSVNDGITDLAGNPLSESTSITFRTGGVVVALNDDVVSQVPVLNEAVNTLAGNLLEPLEFGDSEDGLSSLENALILQVPLVDGIVDLLTGGSLDTVTINGTTFTDFSSAAVAVCDPKSISDADGYDCTLALDLGLNTTQLDALADALTDGDPDEVPALLAELVQALATDDLSTLPSALAEFFVESDQGIELSLVDDDGLPLPSDLEDALTTILDSVAMIEPLEELFSQDDGTALISAELLRGELARVDLGNFASAGVLTGTEALIGKDGVVDLGGSLFDSLAALLSVNEEAPTAADLPLIGTLILQLDQGDLLEGNIASELLTGLSEVLDISEEELDTDTLLLAGNLLSLLDADNLNDDTLSAIGQLLADLDLDKVTDKDIPLVAELLYQLVSTIDLTDNLELVSELLAALNLESLTTETIPQVTELVVELVDADNTQLIDNLLNSLEDSGLINLDLLSDQPILGELLTGLLGSLIS